MYSCGFFWLAPCRPDHAQIGSATAPQIFTKTNSLFWGIYDFKGPGGGSPFAPSSHQVEFAQQFVQRIPKTGAVLQGGRSTQPTSKDAATIATALLGTVEEIIQVIQHGFANNPSQHRRIKVVHLVVGKNAIGRVRGCRAAWRDPQ